MVSRVATRKIWVAGAWYRERSMRREVCVHADENKLDEALDIVVESTTPGDEPERAAGAVRPFEDAGATWWLESMWEGPNGPGELRERLRQGPPR